MKLTACYAGGLVAACCGAAGMLLEHQQASEILPPACCVSLDSARSATTSVRCPRLTLARALPLRYQLLRQRAMPTPKLGASACGLRLWVCRQGYRAPLRSSSSRRETAQGTSGSGRWCALRCGYCRALCTHSAHCVALCRTYSIEGAQRSPPRNGIQYFTKIRLLHALLANAVNAPPIVSLLTNAVSPPPKVTSAGASLPRFIGRGAA